MRKIFLISFIVLFLILNLFGYEIFELELTEEGKVLFQIEHKSAKRVTLAGNFNNWDKNALELKQDEPGIWYTEVNLKPGEYEYKFVIDDNEWIPSENIKFTLKLEEGKLNIEGGKGFKVLYERKSNLKISDKIFITGDYRFLFLPYYNFSKKEGKSFKNRHILNLKPEIYINENVFLNSLLMFDIPELNSLGLWRAKFTLNTYSLRLEFFNSYRTFNFDDPLRSLDKYIYSAYYPLFIYPIEFYNSLVEERKLGYNYRGIYGNFVLKDFDFSGFYVRPIFKNFDLSGGKLRYKFKGDEIGILGIFERGKYDNYPFSDWINLFGDGVYYQIRPNTLYLENSEYLIKKIGFEGYLKLTGFMNLFSEYILKTKDGGFYLETVRSDGKDLPENLEGYGVSYNKAIHYYNTSFKGDEFIIGFHIFYTKNLKSELSIKIDSLNFKPEFLKDVTPVSWTYRILTKFELREFLVANEIRYLEGDEKARYYNYDSGFDELNFYNREISGCYKKFLIRLEMKSQLLKNWKINFNSNFYKYFQRDIYFGRDDKWKSFSIENSILTIYNLNSKISFVSGIRTKYYDFSEYLTYDLFENFKKLFFNYYVGMKYNPDKNFAVLYGIGIEPYLDEEVYDGFQYYLNESVTKTFPFFKEAEEKFANNFFATFRLEVKF